jgi:hypothetical protein
VTFRSRKLLDLARDQPCVSCGTQDGTVVAAHYFGPMRYQLGGGMGHKVTDVATAHLCQRCHAELDSYADGNNGERSERFLLLIIKTLDRLFQEGRVVVK